MKRLIIDTSKTKTYIILANNDKVLNEVLDEKMKVSESLLPKLNEMLNKENVTLKEMDYVGVVLGPGSFTGIRVGIATIKAFVSALRLNLVAKNTFEILKEEIVTGYYISKCTQNSCYFANIENSKIKDIGIINNSEIKDMIAKKQLFQIDTEVYVEDCSFNILTDYEKILLNYFDKYAADSDFISADNLEPYYVQLSQAEIALYEKEKQNGAKNN